MSSNPKYSIPEPPSFAQYRAANDAKNPCRNGQAASRAADISPCAHDLFERQARQNPGAVAVISRCATMTYGELDARAEELAEQLRALGAGPEAVIGLRCRRSAAMLVGAVGILKSGAAYLPIDPADPETRSELMLDDGNVSIEVTEISSRNNPVGNGRRIITLDNHGKMIAPGSRMRSAVPGVRATSKNLAYVIYTSGSTGAPKGVEVTHENLSNLISWHQSSFRVTPQDRASHVAKVGFDAGVWEVWPHLAAGASLQLPDEELLNDPEAFQHWLIDERITISFVPTPLAERLLALDWPAAADLRVMLTGGDALHQFPRSGLPFLLVNNYGPTECTVVATSGLVSSESPAGGTPTIGRPISNTHVYILDESLKEVPVGTAGEIYIGGLGVARGYRNQPELTAERFIHRSAEGNAERLFRTGDLGRYLTDGQIAFLGRADDQIKIRGFRIEPNEIVAALNSHAAVSESVVVAREVTPDDRQLVAYVVSSTGSSPVLAELRDFLGARLPGYMVPALYVELPALPLTPNGKVDRAALPAPDEMNTLRDGDFQEPRTEVERIVAGILAPLLGTDRVDVEANFFSLGGHSLLGTQLISRLRERLGVEVPLRTVFEAPSVADLSAEIEKLLFAKVEAMTAEEVQRALDLAGQI